VEGPLRPEEVGLREYEVMLILPAEADESAVGGAVERITKILSERGGEVKNIDRWGRRRFAYPIARQSEGYYVVVRFTSEPDAITEIDRSLTLADEVVRFKVVVRQDLPVVTADA
jgi:small subunit ribosomal protein S6